MLFPHDGLPGVRAIIRMIAPNAVKKLYFLRILLMLRAIQVGRTRNQETLHQLCGITLKTSNNADR